LYVYVWAVTMLVTVWGEAFLYSRASLKDV
jgi:hypothetical protein